MADNYPIDQALTYLNNSGIAQKQPALYQTIKALIDASRRIQVNTNTLLAASASASSSTSTAGLIAVYTTDPSPVADDNAWLFRDGGSPQTISLRLRIGGVTYDLPLGTI